MSEAPPVVSKLRRAWGLDFARVRRVLVGLTGGGALGELVVASGLPRRDVESILRDLSPFLTTDGDRQSLRSLELEEPSPVDQAAQCALMGALAAGLPPSRWRLDHVPATPETMARRAFYLAAEYELDGASVLCLGDHDLTSLAVGSVAPGAELAVVDIDEPILDHISASAARLGLPVTAAWADLRLALPPSLVATADLVFTDPPYTTEGMRLFLVRALEALRPTGHERVAFCFGTGERHLVKALEVQSLLGDLRLALEAMLPGFNRYDGAEAIGARSDLYICRPTRGARVGEAARPVGRAGPGRSRRPKAPAARIYTRGPSAEEAAVPALRPEVVAAALAAAGDQSPVLVGDGWAAAADPAAAVDLPQYFQRVAAWVTAPRPGPFPITGTPVINTYPDHGGAAVRILILAAPERAVLIAARRDVAPCLAGSPAAARPAGLLLRFLSTTYDVAAVPAGPGGDPVVLLATRHERPPAGATEAVLRHLLRHPGAKVVNAWRDGLMAATRAAGTTMTRNEARARIAADTLPPAVRRLRLWELPASTLRALPAEVARSTAGLDAGPEPGGGDVSRPAEG